MRNLLALLSASLLFLPACSGDDTESGSGASSGTDSGQCLGIDTVGPRGSDQCPATDSVTDSSNSDSNSGTDTDGNTDGTVTDTTPTSGTGNTTDTATDGTTGNTGMTDSDTATTGMTGMTDSDTATTGIEKCENGCEFDATFMVTLDECGHDTFIGLGPTETVRVTVSGTDITIEILGTPGLAPIMGTIDGNGSFTATGTATVAGMPNISVEWTGTLVGTTFSATVNFGPDGDLPGACPMLASMQGDTC